jgi:hypothetical protein
VFTLVHPQPGVSPRLVAPERLSDQDFSDLAGMLGAVTARKTGLVAARQASAEERIHTRWNGKESENTAAPGDWVVTNLAPDQSVLRDAEGHPNQYVIRADRFAALYTRTRKKNEFGTVCSAKDTVRAIHLPGGFEIMAPWGERQIADRGWLLCNSSGDIYGNNAETFEATYEVVASDPA